MNAKGLLKYFFTLMTLVLLAVIGFSIATHTQDADMSVFAQNSSAGPLR